MNNTSQTKLMQDPTTTAISGVTESRCASSPEEKQRPLSLRLYSHALHKHCTCRSPHLLTTEPTVYIHPVIKA